MKAALWKISVRTSLKAEDAVTELLGMELNCPISSWHDLDAGTLEIAGYLDRAPRQVPKLRANLRTGLVRIRAAGLNPGPATMLVRKLRRQDWAHSWKRHFHPLEISRMLLVKPGWSRRRPKKGQAVVVLDPGLSFGTGQHPTTAFCLRELAKHCFEFRVSGFGSRKRAAALGSQLSTLNSQPSFLDIGTGSGILAIAAAKLGYAPVTAFDFDPEAVRVARNNARRNRVLERIDLRRADLTKLPLRSARRYDLVCANLISNLLVAERRKILARLKPSGTLVIAGILTAEFGVVRQAFEGCGLELVRNQREKEWASGAFVFRRRPRWFSIRNSLEAARK